MLNARRHTASTTQSRARLNTRLYSSSDVGIHAIRTVVDNRQKNLLMQFLQSHYILYETRDSDGTYRKGLKAVYQLFHLLSLEDDYSNVLAPSV